MENNKEEKIIETEDIVTDEVAVSPVSGSVNNPARNYSERKFSKNTREPRRNTRHERPVSEFDQKIISIRRVTRVVSGGRRFSFSVAIVIGNKKGSVGVGIGKGGDTALAIAKATKDAKKNMLKLKLNKDMSIPHDVNAKYCSSIITIRPAKGKGLVAGSSVRTVLEFAGINGVSAKVFSRSKNMLNNAMATLKALEAFSV